MADFLGRDFRAPESRHAAAKNAYALLGQHKYDLAAAFFLLSGALGDAVSVLAKERGEPQLALMVARLAGPEATSALQAVVHK
ncbi:uncharacterized protein HaLaN_33201, partial [Haematococcus lacustris]